MAETLLFSPVATEKDRTPLPINYDNPLDFFESYSCMSFYSSRVGFGQVTRLRHPEEGRLDVFFDYEWNYDTRTGIRIPPAFSVWDKHLHNEATGQLSLEELELENMFEKPAQSHAAFNRLIDLALKDVQRRDAEAARYHEKRREEIVAKQGYVTW